jgi:hypothetical protein
MAIQCIIGKGVHRKIYGKICEDICITHGIQHIASLTNLANMGIFYESGTVKEPYPFTELKK